MMRPILAVFALVFLVSAPATAELARELAWRDLAPGGDKLVDPLADLTGDQRLDLEAVAWARAAERRGEISPVGEEYEIAVEMASGLARQGLDVDALVAKYESFRAAVDALNRQVDDGLDGQLVRIPGYALPLEFAGIAVKEFLLVPYFGACIHVPPAAAQPNGVRHARRAIRRERVVRARSDHRPDERRTEHQIAFLCRRPGFAGDAAIPSPAPGSNPTDADSHDRIDRTAALLRNL